MKIDDDFSLICSGLQIEDFYEDLDRCNYRRVAQEADEILKAANMPRLTHDSIEFKRLCRRFLLAKMDLLRTQTEREQGTIRIVRLLPSLLRFFPQLRKVLCSPSWPRSTLQRIHGHDEPQTKCVWSLISS